LIEGLSFKLSPGASYVTNRRSVSFFPSGSDTYSSTSGVKVIKIKLNGTDWLDPSTVKVMFTVNNTTGTMSFLSGGHSFFRRLRVVCNGQIVEDIDDYNRVCEMFNVLQSASVRQNDEIESVARWDGATTDETLAAGGARTIGMKLCSGLLNQTKMLPIRYCPLELELELVNAVADPQQGSTAWNLSDVQIKADLCTLDNALENSYAKHLFEGKALPINYSTYISQSQTLTDFNFTVNVARAVTRLKSIFLTMSGPPASTHTNFLKEFNNFWHPMTTESTSGDYNKGKEVELHVQIGSKLYPEYPMRSVSETFSQLRKTMGIHQSPFHSLDVTGPQYRSYKFIASVDTEKVLEAGFTGLNTRAGDLMTIKVKPMDSGVMASTKPTKFFTVLHSDNIMEIRESGITVFD
jgi:hypothetical protein